MKDKLKVLLTILTVICLIGVFTSCGKPSSEESKKPESIESIVESKEESTVESKEESVVGSEEESTVESEEESVVESEEESTVESEEESVVESVDPVVTYTVTFIDYDDTVISEATYEEGATVDVPETPTRDADETYTYVFAGWDSDVVAVAGDATYKATYTSTYIDYTVTFVDAFGEVVSEKSDYHYGDPVVEATVDETYSSDLFDFEFAGWTPEFSATVVGDVTYVATYTATAKEGYKANNVTASGDNIVLGAGSIGGGASYAIGEQNDDGDETPSFVHQAYFAIDGKFDLDDYVAFDFTGKNMPEVAFFANNYNDSMYANGTTKQGIVVVTGITTWDGQLSSVNGDGTQINYGFPYMIQDASNGGFVSGAFANSALGRANLVDGTHYRVIMGFTEHAESAKITLKWYLYNLDTNTVVEESSMSTWGFFTGSNAQAGNMTRDQLSGSVVLYGKFGTTCTIDKLHGVFANTSVEDVALGLKGEKTFTVTFKDADGNELKTVSDLVFGATVEYTDDLPTPSVVEDALFTYSYAWDKAFTPVYSDAVYTLKLVSTAKSGLSANNVTVQGEGFVLGAGGIGNGANYALGEQNDDGDGTPSFVHQAYLGIDGEYALNNYVVFDFTGKNLPEIAFFANNYNDSMYANGTSKQGIVVVTGITTWDGQLGSNVNGNGTQINYGFPYMIQDAGNGNFVSGAFANSALGRANLVDGTHYRVIMGFTGSDNKITLNWCLYNLDTKAVVEQSSMTTWGFFSGSNAQVGNMTINDLSGSIVLYGKFGTTCTIDKLHGVESGEYADVVEKYVA